MKIHVVGTGPGSLMEMTPRARAVIEGCEVVAGYGLYLEQIRELTHGKQIITSGMTGEAERCSSAIHAALEGKSVCVISGGDAGVYGMAGLVLELATPYPELSIEVIPGVTAACSAAAVLGAPLTHDFAVISLSDRLTDWALIEKRLRLAAHSDFVICLYNPASKARRQHLLRACEVIMECRPPSTPCGVAQSVGREGECSKTMRLDELVIFDADMSTTVFIGNSKTQIINGKLITPRGYGGVDS